MNSTSPCRPRTDAATERIPDAAIHRSDDSSARAAETIVTLQRLVDRGDVRRIFIEDENGRTLIEIPLLLGVRDGPWFEPVRAAAEALAGAAGKVTIRALLEEAWPTSDN